jgi:hypothetical protein
VTDLVNEDIYLHGWGAVAELLSGVGHMAHSNCQEPAMTYENRSISCRRSLHFAAATCIHGEQLN